MKSMTSIARKVAALIVVGSLCVYALVGTAWAYYTDSTRAQGTLPFSWTPSDTPPPKTEVREELDGLNKIIRVENIGDVRALVRVAISYPGSDIEDLDGTVVDADVAIKLTEHWLDGGDGFYYYDKEVLPGEVTEAFTVEVSWKVESEADGITSPSFPDNTEGEESEDTSSGSQAVSPHRAFDITVVQQCTKDFRAIKADDGTIEGYKGSFGNDSFVIKDRSVTLGASSVDSSDE